jgi:hypothetical protein
MQVKAKSRWRFDPNNLKARDVLVIVPVVLALLACIVAFGLHVSREVYIKWGGLTYFTAAILAIVIYDRRELLRTREFWIQLLSALAIHLIAWIILLSHVREWRLAWFLIMILELPAFGFLKDLLDRIRS